MNNAHNKIYGWAHCLLQAQDQVPAALRTHIMRESRNGISSPWLEIREALLAEGSW